MIVILPSRLNTERRETADEELEPLILTFIDMPRRNAEPGDATNRRSQIIALRSAPVLTQDLAEPSAAPTEPVSSAPTSIPPIDWAAEAERAARDVLARQTERDSRRSLSAHPKGMELPPRASGGHKFGDVERFEGGEIIEWINERCYHTNRPPPGPSLGPTQLQLPVCKHR